MDARMGDGNENFSASKAPKRKRKMFQTKVVQEKTPNPTWDFKQQHLLDIDDEMLIKLQSDSITVAVYGMQDGREKFKNLQIADGTSGDRRKSKSITGGPHNHDEAACDNELERLRKENERLMKLLGEKPNP